jgi:glutathione S-transferase
MATLYGIAQSPWTHRAQWALEHHHVRYDYHEHLPMLGEVLLRKKAKAKKASVPLLVDGGPVMGSFSIAKHAEKKGKGDPLFPKEHDAAISGFNDVAEKITNAGRIDVLRKLKTSRAAQRESLPGIFPGVVRTIFAPTAAMAGSFLLGKYDVASDFDVERTLRSAYEEVRKGLGGKPYLLDSFTYADIAIATALQTLRPHPSARLGPGTAESWTHETLAKDFDDLVKWRDTIYAKHR